MWAVLQEAGGGGGAVTQEQKVEKPLILAALCADASLHKWIQRQPRLQSEILS